MPKNLLQDMVKVKRTRVEMPRPQREVLPEPIQDEPDFREEIEIPNTPSKQKPRYMLWSVAALSIIFFLFALSHLFARATVTVNPKIKDVVLNESLSASKDSSADGLSFNLVEISGSESKTINATSQKDVSDSATGTVLIYNAYGTSPQPLSIDTRLVGSNGKIYKTLTKTVVPGMDKKGVPGSVQVKIYASAAGADYNSVPIDFTIFGFKGTAKYSKIYARSNSNIAGGFIGKAAAVSPTDEATAESGLNTALAAKLLQQATNQIPSGFILFKNAIFLNTNGVNNEPNISSTYNPDNSMTLTLQGTLDGILLNEEQLTKKIAQDTIDGYDGTTSVYIPHIEDVTFALADQGNLTFNNLNAIDFTLSGPAQIVWKLDENSLVSDLVGKSKNDFSQVLLQYPNIESAQSVITPFWRRSFPDKVPDIHVIVNYPK